MTFFAELKRRNVLRAGVLYIGAVWALAQGIAQLAPVFGGSEWVTKGFVLAACIGFPFWIAFAWFYAYTPQGLKRESDIAPGEPVRHSTARKLDFAIIAVLTVAVVLLLTNTFVWRRGVGPDAGTRVAGIPDKSIAVLPLVNGGGVGQQFFADGLSEALIIALSQSEGLKVIGRNSSFKFRDSKDDSAAIGHKLGVAHLLEGSVQHVDDVVRISVELIDAASGQTRWSHHYDRPYKDLFKLQDEITQAVAGALQAKLLSPSAATKHNDRPPSGNLDAYAAYLQGLKHWHDQEFPKAAEYMTRAVQLDPGYAMAWAQLSGSLSTVATFWHEAPALARDHMREARLASDKALQLAPGLGAAHAARAYLQFYDLDDRGALAECRRAVQLAPDDGTVLNGCGLVLAGIGRLGEAIQLRERLLSSEPLYTFNYLHYAHLLEETGRLDEAEKYLRTSEEVATPRPLEHLRLAVLRGDANAALEVARQVPPDDRNLSMTLAAQLGTDRAAADQWLADLLAGKAWLEAFDSDGYDNLYKVAQVYALRSDADQTLAWLGRSLAKNPSRALFLLADPFLLRFRDDPRFIAFCKKLGLPPPSESEALGIDQIRAANAQRG